MAFRDFAPISATSRFRAETISGAWGFTGKISIFDSTGADEVHFYHDGADLRLEDITGTTNLRISAMGLQTEAGFRCTSASPMSFGSNEKTISGGSITVSSSRHTVDTQADATTDNLDVINGATADNQLLILSAQSSTRTVVVRDDGVSAGNIALAGSAAFSMGVRADMIGLMWNSALSLWVELFRSDNG
jgi:hypothetical protein